MFYVIWTARLAVVAYLTAIGLFLSRKYGRMAQIVWTAGYAIFCLHVLAAFHFVHHWSHTAALQHTAEQTKALTGWDWGGGIWFNYLFLVVWGLDVLLGWLKLGFRTKNWQRLTNLSCGIQVYLAFIVFNATAIFGPRWWRPLAVVVILLFSGLAYRTRRPRPVLSDSKH